MSHAFFFPAEAGTNKLWKLKRSVYGLAEALRFWYDELHNERDKTDAVQSMHDYALFYWKCDEKLEGILCCHVDDCFNVESVESKVYRKANKLFKQKLKFWFQICDGDLESSVICYIVIPLMVIYLKENQKVDLFCSIAVKDSKLLSYGDHTSWKECKKRYGSWIQGSFRRCRVWHVESIKQKNHLHWCSTCLYNRQSIAFWRSKQYHNSEGQANIHWYLCAETNNKRRRHLEIKTNLIQGTNFWLFN